MKLLRILPLILAALMMGACNDDDGTADDDVTRNVNRNPAPYTALQFPKIKEGKSTVVTHSTPTFGTTYSLEWDHTLKAQRWTCFYFTTENKVKKWYRNQWKNTSWGGDPFQKDPDIPADEQPSVYGEFSGSKYLDKGFTDYISKPVEIKELLVNRKWYYSIFDGIKALYVTTSHSMANRIVELAERYENTLPELEQAVAEYEAKVKAHLERMGFVW